MTVITKALEQTFVIGQRAYWEPQERAGDRCRANRSSEKAAQKARNFDDVHVLDRVETGPKPQLVCDLGATYHTGGGSVLDLDFHPDIIIECTGVGSVIADLFQQVDFRRDHLSHRGWGWRRLRQDSSADMAAAVVLKNNVVFGSVNANKRHWYKAGEALARADRRWLSRLITRREKPENFKQALERQPDDIKVVIQFSEI